MSTRNKIVCAILFLGVAAPVAYFAVVFFSIVSSPAIHQRSVTQSLAAWGKEYSEIRDDSDAWRAIEMIKYIQGYYVVADGYRSDPETEKRLESQRAETIRNISAALDEYINTQASESVEMLRHAKAKVLDAASPAVGQL